MKCHASSVFDRQTETEVGAFVAFIVTGFDVIVVVAECVLRGDYVDNSHNAMQSSAIVRVNQTISSIHDRLR